MDAIDTNVIVRFLVADDPEQTALATACIEGGVFVSHGVLMESEWVIRRRYRWDRARINVAFQDFLRLREVHVTERPALVWALDRHRDGADWADMLHLIAARGHDAFCTFDRDLPRRATSDAPLPARLLA